MNELGKCKECDRAIWTEELEKVAYWKNFDGIKFHIPMCSDCGKHQYWKRTSEGWALGNE